ncbi:MAG: monovalent cation/H(+) antiporter subunit G [Alkalispirochaetaceae bacterium]
MESVRMVAGTLLMGGGLFFFFAMSLGMLRFPDAYTRLHAGTKGLTVGAGLILIGVALRSPTVAFALRALLVGLFLGITNPIAVHAIARANYKSERARRHLVVDEYAERLERQDGS